MDKYLLPEDDGLPIRVFGKWTRQKLDYLSRYIDMFEISMRGKNWCARCYIDLFAGQGKFHIEDQKEIYLGSPLLALTTTQPFTHYFFVDNSHENVDVLKERCSALPNISKRFYIGDANEKVNDIVDSIKLIERNHSKETWSSSLNLAFLDPDGLELEWRTIETLAKVKKMDLIIYYSQLGLNLNLKNCYKVNNETTIDKFFGDSEWRRIYERWKSKSAIAGIHRDLIDYYKSKLHNLGYVDVIEPDTGVEPLMRTSKTNAPLYRLLFASKSKLGHEFWNKVTRKDIWGQSRLL